MKFSPHWIRDFVDLTVDNNRLAEDLTNVGLGVEGVTGEDDDTVWEMEIGTNRPDAMNHYGIAREAAAIYSVPLQPIQPKLPNAVSHTGFKIEIEEPDLCPRFTARVIRNVKIKPSPESIARRLQLLEQRPINNAVDATNYTLWRWESPRTFSTSTCLKAANLSSGGRGWRDSEDAGWHRAQTHTRRLGCRRRRKAGGPRRHHGWLRHHDHRTDPQHTD